MIGIRQITQVNRRNINISFTRIASFDLASIIKADHGSTLEALNRSKLDYVVEREDLFAIIPGQELIIGVNAKDLNQLYVENIACKYCSFQTINIQKTKVSLLIYNASSAKLIAGNTQGQIMLFQKSKTGFNWEEQILDSSEFAAKQQVNARSTIRAFGVAGQFGHLTVMAGKDVTVIDCLQNRVLWKMENGNKSEIGSVAVSVVMKKLMIAFSFLKSFESGAKTRLIDLSFLLSANEFKSLADFEKKQKAHWV